MNALTKKRCAVYCRVSSDERLDQSFNSLDAQREAGMAYVLAQRHEGWELVSDGYADGGYSGGNMERPALRRLLADIEAGRIDIVVVYKIDRLTRSLTDFSRMIEVFERHGVSFVAVTQQFNTTTSMGRLMLNILLSFAQFEREVAGERIRDKIAASKRKGMWLGGNPPLGYDVVDRQLQINAAEGPTVRHIFERFAELGSVTALCQELAQAGVTTKQRRTKAGAILGGMPIDRQYLGKALRNPIYIGEIRHKGKAYPGQHEPLITRELWDQVQAILAEDAKERSVASRTLNRTDALLRGLLFGPDGEKYHPTFTRKKNGKTYRYYQSAVDKRFGYGSSRTGSLPSDEIETLVVNLLVQALQGPEVVQTVWHAVRAKYPSFDEGAVVLAMRNLGAIWPQLFAAEQVRLINLLIKAVRILPEGFDIEWHPAGWAELAGELGAGEIGGELLELETLA